MATTNDGGPAFPFTVTQSHGPKVIGGPQQMVTHVVPGMSKRELFAGLAMQSTIVGMMVCEEAHHYYRDQADEAGMTTTEMVGAVAIKYADTLLAELDKGEPDAGTSSTIAEG